MDIDKIEKKFSILGNFAVIVGVIFAIYQINIAIHAEKRGIAIDVISKTKTSEFLQAQTRLASWPECIAYKNDASLLLYDLNYVLNTYDIVAVYFINNIADRCIIKQGVYQTAIDFKKVLDISDCQKDKRISFDRFIEMIGDVNCEKKFL